MTKWLRARKLCLRLNKFKSSGNADVVLKKGNTVKVLTFAMRKQRFFTFVISFTYSVLEQISACFYQVMEWMIALMCENLLKCYNVTMDIWMNRLLLSIEDIVDLSRNVLICSKENHCIRKWFCETNDSIFFFTPINEFLVNTFFFQKMLMCALKELSSF